MRFWAVVLTLAAVAWTAPAAAQKSQKKVQCWTDKSGQRMCGDRVPPEYAGQQREIMKGGRVVDTVRAAKTPEEVAEEKRQKQEAEEAQRRADYDRALLETYRSAKDIESMRDERLALVDLRIISVEKNASNTDKALIGLKARADKLTAAGKPVDDKLAKQIRQFERDQRQNEKTLERNRKERADIEHKFNSDLERYNALRAERRGITPTPPAAAAAPTVEGTTPKQPVPTAQGAEPPTAPAAKKN